MILEIKNKIDHYFRESKLGKSHKYFRSKQVLIIKCDNCDSIFERDFSSMSPERRSDSYFHVCNNCDPKRFAQKKGAEKRVIWNKLASSTDDISKL